MGNGDLVVDRKTQQMMPPPANIETMLADSVRFILCHIRALLPASAIVSTELGADFNGSKARSQNAKQVSDMLANLVSLLTTLRSGYPSSLTISNAVDAVLKENMQIVSASADSLQKAELSGRCVLVFATLSCGAEMKRSAMVDSLQMFFQLQYTSSNATSLDDEVSRSVFQYAKWGTMCILLTRLLDEADTKSSLPDDLLNLVFEKTTDAVHKVPLRAILPVFRCVVTATRFRYTSNQSVKEKSNESAKRLQNIIDALVQLRDDSESSVEAALMLDEICSLIYRPEILLAEFERLQIDADSLSPVRDSFRDFMKMAGKKRGHIASAVLCRICDGWLGLHSDATKGKSTVGLAAIPYRDDLVSLLISKEDRVDELAANESRNDKRIGRSITIPDATDERSITRGFALVFFSKLPDVDAGLAPEVLSELIHPVIFKLITLVTKKVATLVRGTDEFCLKHRGWQTLCLLSRFVTSEIAEKAGAAVFDCFEEQSHGQIRYFMEIYAIQCSRRHPVVFGRMLVEQITRTDVSLQHISSLMIVAGNLICGRYQLDYFSRENENGIRNANLVLTGAVPWLGSTQSFCKCILLAVSSVVVRYLMFINSYSHSARNCPAACSQARPACY
jgi:hypothetical protein